VLPVVGRFKQLCNKTQERVPVAVYVLPLGPDCDSPYYVPTGNCFGNWLYEVKDLVCHRLYNR